MQKYKMTTISLALLLSACTASEQEKQNQLNSVSDEIDALRTALLDRDYNQVNTLMSQCLNQQPSTEIEEQCLVLYQDGVNQTQPILDALKNWYTTQPNNYHATMLLSSAFYTNAWVHRGHTFSKKISTFRIDEFNYLLHQSIAFAHQAQLLRPDLPYSYATAIDSYGRLQGSGLGVQQKQLINLAAENVPTSIVVARTEIEINQPRWGGSYEAMEKVRNAFELSTDDPSKLKYLNNQIKLIKARDLYTEGVSEYDVEKSRLLFKELLEVNFRPELVHAHLATLETDNDKRLHHIQESLAVNAYNEFNLYTAVGRSLFMNSDINQQAFERYITEYPNSYLWHLWQGQHLFESGKYQQSLTLFEQAQAIEPYQPKPQQYIQVVKSNLGQKVTPFDEQWFIEMAAYSYPRNTVLQQVFVHYASDLEHLADSDKEKIYRRLQEIYNTETLKEQLQRKFTEQQLSKEELEVLLAMFSKVSRVNLLNQEQFITRATSVFSKEQGDQILKKADSALSSILVDLNGKYRSTSEFALSGKK